MAKVERKLCWAGIVAFLLIASPFAGSPFAGSLCAGEAQVVTANGNTVQGEIIQLDADQLVLRSADAERSIARDQLAKIQIAREAKPPKQDGLVQVTLADGSELVARQVTSDAKTLTAATRDGDVAIDAGQVLAIRLRAPSAALDNQWRQIIVGQRPGDVVVVRKTEEMLVPLEGVIESIGEETIKFQFADKTIDVARSKLEGVVLFTKAVTSEPAFELTTVDGSLWLGRQCRADQQQLTITTPGGATATIRWDAVESISFASAQLAYLSDLEPVVTKITPMVESTTSDAVVRFLYQPRRNESVRGERLRLKYPESGQPTQEFEKGLGVHSRTELVWRLDKKFNKLQAIVGMDASVGKQGSVRLEVQSDGERVFDDLIRGGADPIPLSVEIEGTNRLTIIVDYGEDFDMADHLNLCNLRVTQ
ncbi:MAG: NPCBM/NEW2 domain-containing protein [Planctomycetales bacterium]|nr:NPCBM/NEW2 domain-containing protein [Planctomycetales bacterium]